MTVTLAPGADFLACPRCRAVNLCDASTRQVTCGRCNGIITVRWQAQPGPTERKDERQ